MGRSFFAAILIYVFTLQAALAFTPKYDAQNLANNRKILEAAIGSYNSFAANPAQNNFPSGVSSENVQIFKNYMNKNKITNDLPRARLDKYGAIELTLQGETLKLEIDPIVGIIRINGRSLVLKSGQGLNEKLQQIEKFLTPKNTAGTVTKTMESLLSLVVPTASADCSQKYDDAVKVQEGKVDKAATPIKIAAYAMGIGYLLIVLMPAGVAKLIAAVAGVIAAGSTGVFIKNMERDQKNELLLEQLVSIRGALAVAKIGKVPEASTDSRSYTEDEMRFLKLYAEYAQMAKAAGVVPLSQEAMLQALAEGDRSDKFCTPTVIDSISKIGEKIMQSTMINPNEITKSTAPVTPEGSASVVNEGRKDEPKNTSEGMTTPSKNEADPSATSK